MADETRLQAEAAPRACGLGILAEAVLLLPAALIAVAGIAALYLVTP